VPRDLIPALQEIAETLEKQVQARRTAVAELQAEIESAREQWLALREGNPIWPMFAAVVVGVGLGVLTPYLAQLLSR
jgi:hypothetical protein